MWPWWLEYSKYAPIPENLDLAFHSLHETHRRGLFLGKSFLFIGFTQACRNCATEEKIGESVGATETDLTKLAATLQQIDVDFGPSRARASGDENGGRKPARFVVSSSVF